MLHTCNFHTLGTRGRRIVKLRNLARPCLKVKTVKIDRDVDFIHVLWKNTEILFAVILGLFPFAFEWYHQNTSLHHPRQTGASYSEVLWSSRSGCWELFTRVHSTWEASPLLSHTGFKIKPAGSRYQGPGFLTLLSSLALGHAQSDSVEEYFPFCATLHEQVQAIQSSGAVFWFPPWAVAVVPAKPSQTWFPNDQRHGDRCRSSAPFFCCLWNTHLVTHR